MFMNVWCRVPAAGALALCPSNADCARSQLDSKISSWLGCKPRCSSSHPAEGYKTFANRFAMRSTEASTYQHYIKQCNIYERVCIYVNQDQRLKRQAKISFRGNKGMLLERLYGLKKPPNNTPVFEPLADHSKPQCLVFLFFLKSVLRAAWVENAIKLEGLSGPWHLRSTNSCPGQHTVEGCGGGFVLKAAAISPKWDVTWCRQQTCFCLIDLHG